MRNQETEGGADREAVSLPDPECEAGYTYGQIRAILGGRTEDFYRWMSGQTMSMCTGRRYNHETHQTEDACGGVAHGPIVYTWDLERYIQGLPIID